MAARLTDKQKKKIIADYLELGSYRAVGKKNGVSADSVKRVISKTDGFEQKAAQKKEENTADILAYMESKRQSVCQILDVGLQVLPEKIAGAKSASEVTTAMGTLIDKWTAVSGSPQDESYEDELSRSLRELGKELESDD
ncbi:MAG: helix-turn-helix domain containing protein [Clostridium sp.]|nr:helix-turn-helix domain containing protein [Clostridium sp.]MCM1547931.1 helix-turn-helix domain containing protein [Ruminococcus sp.]